MRFLVGKLCKRVLKIKMYFILDMLNGNVFYSRYVKLLKG